MAKVVCKPKRHVISAASVLALLIAMSLLSGCRSTNNAGVIVAGSTSVQPYAEVLAEEFMILHPDIVIDIQGGGSSAGIMAAKTGTSNLGMSSRVLKDDETSLWYVEIARDGLAVIINPDNPISNLTLEQISDIYSAKITNWSELGGPDEKIHIITREDGSGTRDAFVNLVMGESSITPKAIVQDSNGAVRQLVADDPNAIGFISLGLVDDTVKALELDGVAATRENVLNGTYNLSRPFLFIAQSEPTGQTKEFLDFVLSPEGQQLLMNEGLISPLEGATT
jgi:phosphate transport system substrate-binding protein